MSRTSETIQTVTCKELFSGMVCLPGSGPGPESLKSLKVCNQWGFLRLMIETGKKQMNAEVDQQEVDKSTNRMKDSRIRILRLPQDSEAN